MADPNAAANVPPAQAGNPAAQAANQAAPAANQPAQGANPGQAAGQAGAAAANQPAVQALVAALQQLLQQGQAPLAANPVVDVSPYAGGPIDLRTRTGNSLFFEATKELSTTFSGKYDELYLFLSDLEERAKTCYWNDPVHGILNFTKNGETYFLLRDYGALEKSDIDAARLARRNGNDVRARQNALMMYRCIYASLTDDAKADLISRDIDELEEDGPTLFFLVVSTTYTATFSHAQSARMMLQGLDPKKYNYDITKVNAIIKIALRDIQTGSHGSNVAPSEVLFYVLQAYKKIKVPQEWASHIQFLESSISLTPNYDPKTLMVEGARKYNELKDTGLWKPSNRSMTEQVVAMLGDFKSKKKPKTDGKKATDGKKKDGKTKDKKRSADKPRSLPPFIDSPGKIGDTKTWNDQTYHYCEGKHKHRWVLHHPDDCGNRGNPKSDGGKDKERIKVNRGKLKKAFAALQDSEAAPSKADDASNDSDEAKAHAIMALLKE